MALLVSGLFEVLQASGLIAKNHSLALTLGYLAFAPFAVGFLIVAFAQRRRALTVWQEALYPCAVFSILALVLFVVKAEGLICIVMALPILWVSAALGGFLAGFVFDRTPEKEKLRDTKLMSILLLPLLVSYVETKATAPMQIRNVHTQIRIHASAHRVWNHIKRVDAISPSELKPSWTHAIGFPRPIAATLSEESVGGVREATFEHGLKFFETVTEWNPNRSLAFTIRADTAHIPPTTLDEHVTIGGRYFDVLRGEYRLHDEGNGWVLLELSSDERLSTTLNFYAGLWTEAVMRNLQESILEVIQRRCEAA